jgi:hypothetical protein
MDIVYSSYLDRINGKKGDVITGTFGTEETTMHS